MLPYTLGKAQFAMMLYGIDDPIRAAHCLYREYSQSSSLQSALRAVGYQPRSKKFRRQEMHIICHVLGIDEEELMT